MYTEVGRADLAPGGLGMGGPGIGPGGFGVGGDLGGNMFGPRHPAFGNLNFLQGCQRQQLEIARDRQQ